MGCCQPSDNRKTTRWCQFRNLRAAAGLSEAPRSLHSTRQTAGWPINRLLDIPALRQTRDDRRHGSPEAGPAQAWSTVVYKKDGCLGDSPRPPQLDVLQTLARGYQVVGDIQHVVRLVIRLVC